MFGPEITERLALLTQQTADVFAVYEVVGERIDQRAPVLTRRTWQYTEKTLISQGGPFREAGETAT